MRQSRRICITSLGSGLDSQVDFRSTQAQYFLIFNEKGGLEEAILNSHIKPDESPRFAIQELADKGVSIFITSSVDNNTFSALNAAEIKVFSVPPNLTAKQAFTLWHRDRISVLMAPNQAGNLEGGRGRGMGRGFGGGLGERNFRFNPQKRR